MHTDDEFAGKYVKDVGHYDFGANLKPINFASWFERFPGLDASGLEFWLRYWVEAYSHVLCRTDGHIHLLPYGELTGRSEETLVRLAKITHVEPPTLLTGQSLSLRAPRTHTIETSSIDPALIRQAEEIYDELMARSRQHTKEPSSLRRVCSWRKRSF